VAAAAAAGRGEGRRRERGGWKWVRVWIGEGVFRKTIRGRFFVK